MVTFSAQTGGWPQALGVRKCTRCTNNDQNSWTTFTLQNETYTHKFENMKRLLLFKCDKLATALPSSKEKKKTPRIIKNDKDEGRKKKR